MNQNKNARMNDERNRISKPIADLIKLLFGEEKRPEEDIELVCEKVREAQRALFEKGVADTPEKRKNLVGEADRPYQIIQTASRLDSARIKAVYALPSAVKSLALANVELAIFIEDSLKSLQGQEEK